MTQMLLRSSVYAEDSASLREAERLEALDRLDILDTPSEEAFDRITRLSRKLFDVPVAIVSFIDAHRQWYKSCAGMQADQVPREHTFCRHMLDQGQPLIVEDATKDSRFSQNPYVVGDPAVRFYAGMPLKDSEGSVVGSLCIVDTKPREFDEAQVELLSDLAEISMDELKLRQRASLDSLTGALSRRSFKEEARRAVSLALRHQNDLSLIAFDLDFFKSINDRFGHAAGDIVLTRVVKVCKSVLRETDLLGRLGGEEFAILLPQTSLAGAMDVAEKIGAAIAEIDFGFDAKVTASLGAASLDAVTRSADALMEHADRVLYEAKKAGRNRAVAFRDPSSTMPPRRRVLKAGQIVFNGGRSAVDCTVRTLSDDGAGLDVSSSVGLPKTFDLAVSADRIRKAARVVSQTERHIEVVFVRPLE